MILREIVFLIVLVGMVLPIATHADEPIRLGARRQLFLDDYLIAWTEKLERRVNPVVKHTANPIVRPVEDWEPNGYLLFGSVLYDEQEHIYKMWSMGTGGTRVQGVEPRLTSALFYFTSSDGVSWHRPQLDVVEINGTRTNISTLLESANHPASLPHAREFVGVIKDARDPDPARRYKLAYFYLVENYSGPNESPYHSGQMRGLGTAFSPDGIRWTAAADRPASYAIVDGYGSFFQAPDTGEFHYYGRTKHYDPEVLHLYGRDRQFQLTNWGRAVNHISSRDFTHWQPEKGNLVMAADALDGPGDEIYSLTVFPYEGLYIGLVQVLHNYPERVWLDYQLAVSRDEVRFDRLSDRSPFIPVGGIGEWDRFNQSAACNPPLRVGDELRFYYSGRNYVHGGRYDGADNGASAGLRYRAAIGVGSVKTDRFAGLEATFDTGRLRTKPIVLDGSRLHVNADVEFGKLQVKVLGEDRQPIEGLEATVQEMDAIDLEVPLKGLDSVKGRTVHLEFMVTNGKLYSVWME